MFNINIRQDNKNPDMRQLSRLQRVLLTTDGTLTEILEAYFLECVQLIKLSECLNHSPISIPMLNVAQQERVIERNILLRGSVSKRNFVYAESIVVVDRLDMELQEKLTTTQVPMGRLWLEHKLETFKEMIEIKRESAGELAGYFNVQPDEDILARTYRVFSKKVPIILITEKFPVRGFS